MAGLLDWLTEGVGSATAGAGPGMPPMPAPKSLPMPPVQMTGTDSYPIGSDPMAAGGPPPFNSDPVTAGGQMPNGPGLPFAPGSDPMTAGGTQFPPGADPMTAGGASANGPGLPSPPMPMPQPPGANASPAALPPSAAPTGGTGMPPGPASSMLPPNAAPSLVPQGGGATGFIGRALGLDRNSERKFSGSLASGLKSVGDNVHKPGLAAFAGSAGSALEGGNTADDKTTDQRQKFLTQAIAAAQSGNTQALNVARTRLALAQAKAAEETAGKPDKASVMNSQEQLYLRGLGAVNQDAKVKASLAQLRQVQTQFGPDSKEAKAALEGHNSLIEGTKKQVFSTLGVNEKEAAKIGKQPGFAADNPVPAAGLTKEKFDKLPVGAYFINPKDNRLLIKQPPAGANPAAPAQSAAPAAPVPVTAPAGSAADREDDE